MAIAMIMAAVDAAKYISVGGKEVCGCCVGVGAVASDTSIAVCAYDGQ